MFYLRFCSTIYHLYVRKNDDMPAVYAFFASSFIVFANFFGIYNIITYFFYPNLSSTNYVGYTFAGVICFLNYLLVFLPAKYKEVKPKPKSVRNTIIYIIVSVAFLMVMAKLHHDRNVKKQNQQMEIQQ